MPEEALTAFTVSDAYRQFAGQAQLLRSESRSRKGFLIPTNNIIVLNSYFNFTNKSNLISILKYDLIHFFNHLGVAYFFGPPCTVLNAKVIRTLRISTGALFHIHNSFQAYGSLPRCTRVTQCLYIFNCYSQSVCVFICNVGILLSLVFDDA